MRKSLRKSVRRRKSKLRKSVKRRDGYSDRDEQYRYMKRHGVPIHSVSGSRSRKIRKRKRITSDKKRSSRISSRSRSRSRISSRKRSNSSIKSLCGHCNKPKEECSIFLEMNSAV